MRIQPPIYEQQSDNNAEKGPNSKRQKGDDCEEHFQQFFGHQVKLKNFRQWEAH
jgi:hypothetical protein